ncbi:MAG: IS110 family transposase [Myxococcota bacterium]
MKDRFLVLGVDVAKKTFDVSLLQEENRHKSARFTNTSNGYKNLWKWLKKRKATGCFACLEATGSYGENLALFLHENGIQVSIVNPARVKGFRQSELGRTKTDEADAALIARFCRAMKPDVWEPPASHVRMLQALVYRLENLNTMLRQESNRLQVIHEGLKENVKLSIQFIEKQISDLKKQIKEHINKHEDLKEKQKLLESIPGVGDVTIATILTFLEQPQKFRCAKQVAAFVGLNPKQCLSGSSVRGRTRLSKTGNSLLRRSLYMPALSAKRCNPVLAAFARHLQKEGKSNMVILGAIMRKLMHIIYGVLKSGQPFNPSLCSPRA